MEEGVVMKKRIVILIDNSPIAGFPNLSFEVYELSVYGSRHMFAGQPCQMNINSFDTLEEAKAAYPKAEVVEDLPYYAGPVLPSYLS